MALHPDHRDILAEFARHGVEYLIVGGYAVGFHGTPRFTKHIDLWIAAHTENLEKVRAALVRFGAPSAVLQHLDDATS